MKKVEWKDPLSKETWILQKGDSVNLNLGFVMKRGRFRFDLGAVQMAARAEVERQAGLQKTAPTRPVGSKRRRVKMSKFIVEIKGVSSFSDAKEIIDALAQKSEGKELQSISQMSRFSDKNGETVIAVIKPYISDAEQLASTQQAAAT